MWLKSEIVVPPFILRVWHSVSQSYSYTAQKLKETALQFQWIQDLKQKILLRQPGDLNEDL